MPTVRDSPNLQGVAMSRADVLVTADWAAKNIGADGIVFG
jgi:hypothetical protein